MGNRPTTAFTSKQVDHWQTRWSTWEECFNVCDRYLYRCATWCTAVHVGNTTIRVTERCDMNVYMWLWPHVRWKTMLHVPGDKCSLVHDISIKERAWDSEPQAIQIDCALQCCHAHNLSNYILDRVLTCNYYYSLYYTFYQFIRPRSKQQWF